MAILVAAIAKISAAVLTNVNTCNAAGWVIADVLSLVILLIVLLCCLVSGTADYNNSAVDLAFHSA